MRCLHALAGLPGFVFLCGWLGHHDMLMFDGPFMSVRCFRCDRQSGWLLMGPSSIRSHFTEESH